MPKCIYCHQTSPRDEFTDTEVGCDDCGSHGALLCPKCNKAMDLIYNKLEEDK